MKLLFSYIILLLLLSCNNKIEKIDYYSKDLEEMNLFGKVKSVKIYSNENEYEEFYFDRLGNKIKLIEYENDDENITEYKYNVSKKLESKISYYSFNQKDTLSLYKYTYNNLGLLAREDYYEDGIYLTSYNIFEYNNKNNLSKIDMYDSYLEGLEDGEIGYSETILYSYNDKNLRIKAQVYYKDKMLSEIIYEYDNSDNIISVKEIDSKGNISICNNEYDRFNNVVYQFCSDVEKKINIKYEYDFKNNWTIKVQEVKSEGSIGIVGKREIIYF